MYNISRTPIVTKLIVTLMLILTGILSTSHK